MATLERWIWLLTAAAAAFMVWNFGHEGQWLVAASAGLIGLVVAWSTSPWYRGRSVRHREVMRRPENQRPVVVYWRPGCRFCARLRSVVRCSAGQATWVNIWQDDEAAAFVRDVNGGDERVPTVVLDGVPVSNPDPGLVLARLNQETTK